MTFDVPIRTSDIQLLLRLDDFTRDWCGAILDGEAILEVEGVVASRRISVWAEDAMRFWRELHTSDSSRNCVVSLVSVEDDLELELELLAETSPRLFTVRGKLLLGLHFEPTATIFFGPSALSLQLAETIDALTDIATLLQHPAIRR